MPLLLGSSTLKAKPKPKPKKNTEIERAERILAQVGRTIKHPKPSEDGKEAAKINRSVFRKAIKRFKRSNIDINADDFDEESNKFVLNALKNMLIELMAIAEENYRTYKNERASYPINLYANQIREIINDIRAIEDFQARSDRIKDIFHRHYLLIVQNFFDESLKCKTNMISSLDIANENAKTTIVNNVMVEFLKDHSKYIKEIERSVEAQIDDFLVRKSSSNTTRKMKTVAIR